MKKLIITLIALLPFLAKAQLVTFILHGDTLYAKNPTNINDSIQLNRFGAVSRSDTAGMLLPYLRSSVAASTYQPIGNYMIVNQAIAQSQITNLVSDLALKAPLNSPTFTGTVSGITATMVGLGNVTNESKATMFTSPTFTGTVTLPNSTVTNAMLAGSITESKFIFSDVTTGNASITAHGFLPKLSNSATQYLNGTGVFSTPTGINSTIVWLAADVANSNATANTIADVTGLSFAVTAGVTYRFKFFIVYSSAATTTGSRWAINGPAAPTFLNYRSTYTLTATSETTNSGVAAYDSPSASNASSLSTGNIAIIEGIIKPSANGTVIARFASEISASAITAKANQSYVEYQAIN